MNEADLDGTRTWLLGGSWRDLPSCECGHDAIWHSFVHPHVCIYAPVVGRRGEEQIGAGWVYGGRSCFCPGMKPKWDMNVIRQELTEIELDLR